MGMDAAFLMPAFNLIMHIFSHRGWDIGGVNVPIPRDASEMRGVSRMRILQNIRITRCMGERLRLGGTVMKMGDE